MTPEVSRSGGNKMTEKSGTILQLPVSCLAEYATRGGRSPESVLRPYKFRKTGEGIARILFRPPVVTVIRKYFRLNRDATVFEDALADWHIRADATAKKGQRSKLHSNISALTLFRLRYAHREFEILPAHKISYQIGQIVFTASPDLWVKENGQEHLIKIGFGKRSRSYIDILLAVMRRAALAHHHRIRPRNAVYLSVLTGEELVSRFAYRDLALTLTAAASEIAKAWPKVAQLGTVPRIGSGARPSDATHDSANG
jgi:hypothetical protein